MSNIPLQVICQHNMDGTMFPIKIQFSDDDGETREYKIKKYKQKGETKSIFPFECIIENFGRAVKIEIFYSSYERKWWMKHP